MRIGIVGGGFVGSATALFGGKNVEVVMYDINPKLCVPEGTVLEDMGMCDLIFVCVPTPMTSSGGCYTTIVEDVVNKLKKITSNERIILRSTVPPYTSNALKVSFMPEFLTERNWKNDFVSTETWVLGSPFIYTCNKFQQLINLAHTNTSIAHQNVAIMESCEAELVKYYRNTFLAMKVGFSNEIFNLCLKLGINYEKIREVASKDSRIGPSHTKVGMDGHFGFGGTCLPKDLSALLDVFKRQDVASPILSAVRYRNDNIDRPEKDWMNDKGRAYV